MTVDLPLGLRDRVIAAAEASRTPGRPVPTAIAITPAEAVRRAAEALAELLAELDDVQWACRVLRDLDVQGLVGHLVGVESDTRRALLGDAAVADVDHVESTHGDALRQAGRPPADTLREWEQSVAQTLDLAASYDDDTPIALHGMRLPLRALLVVRAFELWTHENDVRSALGLPASAPGEPNLLLMTDLAARMLPRGAEQAGLDDAVDLHLVLTGPGGGTWDVRIGDALLEPTDVMLVVDAVDFCRVVADRLAPADLALQAGGSWEAVADVLLSAAALALD